MFKNYLAIGLYISLILMLVSVSSFAAEGGFDGGLGSGGSDGVQISIGGMPEKTELLKLVLSIRFMEDQLELTLNEEQAQQLLEGIYNYIEKGYLLSAQAFSDDVLDILTTTLDKDKEVLLSGKNNEFINLRREYSDPQKFIGEMQKRYQEAIKAVRKILNKNQLNYIDKLDLSKFIDLSDLSIGSGRVPGQGGDPGSSSGQKQSNLQEDSPVVMLFEELIWLLTM